MWPLRFAVKRLFDAKLKIFDKLERYGWAGVDLLQGMSPSEKPAK